jgi:uncharacterized membrane protein YhhN
MNLKSLPLRLFFYAAILHVVGIILNWNESTVIMQAILFASKALLMPTLLWHAKISLKDFAKPYHRFIFSALIFSWIGDILLTWKEPVYFLSGLCAFLVAHLFYIATYYSETNFKQFNLLKQKPYLVLPYLVIVGFFLFKTHEKLGMFIIPVGIYSLVLGTMSSFALNRYKNVTENSFWFTYIGSLLFMFSDFVIGWTVFAQPLEHSSLIIMNTYITGQFLIIKGLIHQSTPVLKS